MQCRLGRPNYELVANYIADTPLAGWCMLPEVARFGLILAKELI